MNNIVVPIDFSKCSEYALQAAAKIAKKYNAKITALHMINLSSSFTGFNDKEQYEVIHYIKRVELRFKDFLNKDYLKDLVVEDSVHSYNNFTDVNTIAKNLKADLIIMGSHGVSGFNEIFVGSNTEKVVRTSEIPVLVIKGDPVDFNFDRVVFASEFRENQIDIYKKAMRLFELFNAKVQLIYINLPADRFRSNLQLKSRFKNFFEKAEDGDSSKAEEVVIYNDYSVESGVFNYSEENKSSLIAIPTHGRRGLAHFFSGSIGEDIVNKSKLPVITFKM